MVEVADIRREYEGREFRRASLSDDPFEQFKNWLNEAVVEDVIEPTAMCLSTIGLDGFPVSRMVLLKAFDSSGFYWFTSRNSRKSKQLAASPVASICFYWKELDRQVLCRGAVEEVDRSIAVDYFIKRPRGSQIASWASRESEEIQNRTILEDRYKHFEKEFQDKEVPAPPDWTGYCLRPLVFEFWQGRLNRLHDRFEYQIISGKWHIQRLQP